jgi:hypothetical protein
MSMTFHRLPFPILLDDYRRRRQATFELQDDPDLASAPDSLARIVRSVCSWTRSKPRTRSGASAHSLLGRPNSP